MSSSHVSHSKATPTYSPQPIKQEDPSQGDHIEAHVDQRRHHHGHCIARGYETGESSIISTPGICVLVHPKQKGTWTPAHRGVLTIQGIYLMELRLWAGLNESLNWTIFSCLFTDWHHSYKLSLSPAHRRDSIRYIPRIVRTPHLVHCHLPSHVAPLIARAGSLSSIHFL